MRLCVAARARPVEQQYLAGFLRHRASEVLLDEIGGERRSARAAGAGDARAVREEQAVGDHFLVREGLEEILVVVPADARAAALHEPGAAQHEAAGADADEGDRCRPHLAQVARGGLIDLRPGVQQAADDHDIVERLRGQQGARRLNQYAAAGGDGFRAAGHDRPLHVQRTAAIAFIGRQPQVIDEHGERGQREVVGQNDADAQGRPHSAFRCSRSHYCG